MISEHYNVSLAQLIERKAQHYGGEGGLREQRVAKYAFQILKGLSALHECGITHRNLSPSNILIDSSVCARCEARSLADCAYRAM